MAGSLIAGGYSGPPALTLSRVVTSWTLDIPVLAAVLVVAGLYLAGTRRLRRAGQPWPAARTFSFLVGGTGALVLPTVASASSATHTLKFISVEKASVGFTKTTGGQQDTDVNATGKTVGFDMLYFSATSATTANINVTGDFSGGFLYGTGTINMKTGAFSNGKVTGGTGSFKGATGTIKAKNLNKAGTRTAVTIIYS